MKEQVKDKWRGRDLFKGSEESDSADRVLSRAQGTERGGKKE